MNRDRKTKIDELMSKQNEAEKRKQERLNQLRIACKETFNDVNGKYILNFLKEICLWCDQDMNINHDSIVYKKGRSDVWLIFRTLLPKDILAQVEIYEEKRLDE